MVERYLWKRPPTGFQPDPYSLIDAVNRVSLATGSIYSAMASHGADYNGHYVSVYFNDYREAVDSMGGQASPG